MIRIEIADAKSLQKVYRDCRSGVICTPFFSEDGLSIVLPHIINSSKVDLILRTNIYDWVTGYANLLDMKTFLDKLMDSGASPTLYVRPSLHAKIYASIERKRAYFGSANLTSAAFHSNLEIMTYTEARDSAAILNIIDEIKNMSLPVPINDFYAMVGVSEDAVAALAKKSKLDFDSDPDFNAAVRLFSDELHRIVIRKPAGTKPKKRTVVPNEHNDFDELGNGWPTLVEFIRYCAKLKAVGAHEIVARHEGKANLQGHIKHVFYGSLFFFYEHPDLIDTIPPDLAKREHVIWSAEKWVPQWVSYLHRHESEFYDNISFSYHTLMTYLPTSLGGVQVTGGASSGNFKKVMSFLSKMLKENKK